MPDLNYPYTQVLAAFPSDGHISVVLSIQHDGDGVDDGDVIDAVKDVLTTAGATSVDALTSSVITTPA